MSVQFLCLHFLLFHLRAYYNTRLQLERAHLLTQVREYTSAVITIFVIVTKNSQPSTN